MPLAVHGGLISPHPQQYLFSFLFFIFDNSHLCGCEVVSYFGFDLFALTDYEDHYAYWLFVYILFKEMLIQVLFPLGFLLLLSCRVSLCIIGIKH